MASTHIAVATTAKGVFDVIQLPTPVPKGDEVLIKVDYSSLIAFDTYTTDRGYFVKEYPLVLGFSNSGFINKIGPDVHDFKVGDRVTAFGFSDNGRDGLKSPNKGIQEYSLQSRKKVAKIPETLPLDAASTIPDNFVTAYYTLFSQLGLPIPTSWPATETPPEASTPILIYGAGATSGVYAIQLLRLAGYQKVIATASTKNHEYLRSLGATHVFDYSSPTVVEDIANAAGGDRKIPYAVDCITAEGTMEFISRVISPSAKVALLLPIKEGNTVTNDKDAGLYFSIPEGKNPFPTGTEAILVRTFLFLEDERMNNLMPEILSELLQSGAIQPSRVLLMDKGSLRERVDTGLSLLREIKSVERK